MKIIQRLRNIWKLGELETPKEGIKYTIAPMNNTVRLAQIIKRTTPVEDFMKKTNE